MHFLLGILWKRWSVLVLYPVCCPSGNLCLLLDPGMKVPLPLPNCRQSHVYESPSNIN